MTPAHRGSHGYECAPKCRMSADYTASVSNRQDQQSPTSHRGPGPRRLNEDSLDTLYATRSRKACGANQSCTVLSWSFHSSTASPVPFPRRPCSRVRFSANPQSRLPQATETGVAHRATLLRGLRCHISSCVPSQLFPAVYVSMYLCVYACVCVYVLCMFRHVCLCI